MRVLSVVLSIAVAVPSMASAGGALSEPAFERAISAAASGDARRLRELVALRPASDGARAETIDLSLSRALATNPRAVLRLARAHPDTVRTEWVCRDRTIEPTRSVAAAFVANATSALKRVHDPKLAGLRDRCVADLHGTT